MMVSTQDLRQAALRLLDHLDEVGQSSFEIDEDYYWAIPPDARYDATRRPVELTVGQLSDDWREIRAITTGRSKPIGFALVWLGSILRRVGEKAVG